MFEAISFASSSTLMGSPEYIVFGVAVVAEQPELVALPLVYTYTRRHLLNTDTLVYCHLVELIHLFHCTCTQDQVLEVLA